MTGREYLIKYKKDVLEMLDQIIAEATLADGDLEVFRPPMEAHDGMQPGPAGWLKLHLQINFDKILMKHAETS